MTPALLRSSRDGSASGLTAYAATLVTSPLGERAASASNQNEQNQNNSNSNDNDQNNNDNNNNGNDNQNNGNDNNNNGTKTTTRTMANDNHMDIPPLSPRQVDAPPPSPVCSTPGQGHHVHVIRWPHLGPRLPIDGAVRENHDPVADRRGIGSAAARAEGG